MRKIRILFFIILSILIISKVHWIFQNPINDMELYHILVSEFIQKNGRIPFGEEFIPKFQTYYAWTPLFHLTTAFFMNFLSFDMIRVLFVASSNLAVVYLLYKIFKKYDSTGLVAVSTFFIVGIWEYTNYFIPMLMVLPLMLATYYYFSKGNRLFLLFFTLSFLTKSFLPLVLLPLMFIKINRKEFLMALLVGIVLTTPIFYTKIGELIDVYQLTPSSLITLREPFDNFDEYMLILFKTGFLFSLPFILLLDKEQFLDLGIWYFLALIFIFIIQINDIRYILFNSLPVVLIIFLSYKNIKPIKKYLSYMLLIILILLIGFNINEILGFNFLFYSVDPPRGEGFHKMVEYVRNIPDDTLILSPYCMIIHNWTGKKCHYGFSYFQIIEFDKPTHIVQSCAYTRFENFIEDYFNTSLELNESCYQVYKICGYDSVKFC